MGSKIGHVAPGFGFLIIGLWHLYNNIKLFSYHPNTFRSHSWFPFPKFRHLELVLIAMGGCTSIAMELFIGPSRHQPLDVDFTIPTNHLHNFEHSSISLSFVIYAVLARALDRAARPAAAQPLTLIATTAAFGQEFLLFYLHSTDHAGLEGQYHWLLRIVIAVSFATSLLGISHPCNFAIAFVRSASITLQGIWFIFLGYALWTPAFIPKGCYMHDEDGHFVVRCRSDEALYRAKSLANLEFSWVFSAAVVFSFLFYLYLSKRYEKELEYESIDVEEPEDSELRKKINSKLGESDTFVFMEKVMSAV
ncbi:transmembrane protein 45B-like [Dendrobium catenatum]|uniref:Transmembrane protein 45B n=1 Tax=Dendrobium catenatum TaxID=906689 RepID=A0A2I0VDY2_9ASPA|nr:transmembrane protein 45B-like [Dendrobium catenatum]PKU61618.1 hypothetical protein MA16_Dca027194 [Dendrobium catenatum]